MKVINKMMAIILLSGTGIGSVQAQDTTPQTWTLRQCIDSAELKWWYQPGVELGTYSFSER